MSSPAGGFVYPDTKREGTSDTYYGQVVQDPYKWLEHPDNAEVEAWVNSQNAVTSSYLSTCEYKQPLESRLKEVYNYERVSCPFRKGNTVFYFRNSGLQNQSVLYMKEASAAPSEEGVVLLDPNTLAADGTAALGAYAVSEDASLLAYGVSRSGSDWSTIYVMRIKDRVVLESEKCDWVKFSDISWTHDNAGFFYSRYPQPEVFKAATPEQEADPDFKRGTETTAARDHQVHYHRVGTKQDADVKVFATPENPQWILGGEVSDDGLHLILTMSESCDTKNRLFIAPLNKDFSYASAAAASSSNGSDVLKLVDRFEAEFRYVFNEGSKFYFKTNHTAGRYKLICMDVSRGAAIGSDPSGWSTIIPEHAKDVLDSVSTVNKNQFLTVVSRDVKQVLSLYSSSGELLVAEFPLPDVGSISGLTSRTQDQSFFYSFSSFLYPGTIYSVDLTEKAPEKQATVFREIKVAGFDASLFQTKQVFYPSKDGTLIPMFVVHRKDLVKDGSNPTWLYGYGGFNISLPPSFSVARIVFMQHFGGVFACANIRGGGEYGEEWYKSGVLQKKQNVFDDFIAAAEYLIQEKFTSPKKLAINGGSNGGLLVCACLNQRPDLYGAVIGQVGVLDMLKFHTWTIGMHWSSDYGNVDQSEDMFRYLLGYSPVHNVRKDAPYPALLLTTSDHDDRVSPLHSYKYISEVQSKVAKHPKQTAPLMIRIETKAGHGAGMPLSKRIVEQADMIAFMAKTLDAKGKF